MQHNTLAPDILTLLMVCLKEGKNPSFRYNKNPTSLLDFTKYIISLIETLHISPKNIDVIFTLIKNHDYRFIASYLKAHKADKKNLIDMFHRVVALENKVEANKLKYLLKVASMPSVEKPQKINAYFTSTLNEIFHTDNNEIKIYLLEESYKIHLITLLNDIGYRIGDYIEQQYDVPTLNALISQGIVKVWIMPNGQETISKKNNPLKPEIFYKEQNNHAAIIKKFNGKTILLTKEKSRKKEVLLELASPFAIIKEGSSQQEYALSIKVEGVLLVDLLMSKIAQSERERHLFHYRLILDALCDRGIIWGDMALRNIIVQEKEKIITYYIFDFEKTQILDQAVPLSKRIEHCRGQICVEELCTICTIPEVTKYLSDYFDPVNWDFISTKNITFPPRDEVLEIVSIKKKNYVPLGEYNSKDYKIMKMREVKINPLNGENIFLGHLGFKVEHYLSCVGFKNARKYENLLTTILIDFEDSSYYIKTINLLSELLDIIEYTFIKTEFQHIFYCITNYSHNKNIIELANYLIYTLDTLYNTLSYEKKMNTTNSGN